MSPYRAAPTTPPCVHRRRSKAARLFRAGRERWSSPISAGHVGVAVDIFTIAVSYVLFTPTRWNIDAALVVAAGVAIVGGLLFVLARGWYRCRRMRRTIYVHRTPRPRTPLDDLILNAPYNPRFMTETARRKLRAGIRKNGNLGSLNWNERTGHLIGGHQRITLFDEANGTDN